MTTRHAILTLLLAALLCIPAAAEEEQPIEQQAKSDDANQHVEHTYPIKHRDLEEMLVLLRGADLLDDMTVYSSHDGEGVTLLLSGPVERHQQIAQFIQRMDKPANQTEATEQDESQNVLQVYPLRYTQIGDASGMLRSLGLMQGPGKIGFDTSRNALVVRAPAETHQLIQEFIATVDTPKRETTAPAAPTAEQWRLIWLVQDLPSGARPLQMARKVIGADVRDVLEKIGLGDLYVAGQLVVTTTSDPKQGFRVEGIRHIADESFEIGFSGSKSTDDSQYNLSTTIRGTPDGEEWFEVFSARTTLDVPVNHPIVLGVSPSGDMTSVAIIIRGHASMTKENNGSRR